ncbi:hypothetical protein [uncultured Paraglaciecola sp.]|uniref:hypothetical protein n=1 Tax=uncultured Paraglaciecola sp. TaxID=1765024 RepID=UPI002608C74A|nr:hypothetical protein [uncultured Paraglaciecola sp.]
MTTDAEKLEQDKIDTREALAIDGMREALSTLQGRAYIWTTLEGAGFMQRVLPENSDKYNHAHAEFERLLLCDRDNALLMIKENNS